MNKTIVAVGGGEIGRIEVLADGSLRKTDIETTLIDKFIVEATGKEHPKMLFVGTASRDKVAYLEVVREHFVNRIGCASVEPLNLVETTLSTDEIREKIFSSDIIYVGGGDTTTMLKIWKHLGVDRMLYEAYQKGIVLSGISAGAICWFEYYDNMDDITDIEDLDIISGLGFVKGFGVPHYNQLSDDEKRRINLKLKEKGLHGWSIDDCVALVFINDEMSVLSCREDRTSILVP
ncbi:MAG: Type 1 glutamine amidotransferase-like domain-containing protein [Alphaproteobacteria bacterium]|nr:Type 1 glutamine amidotransferase-like domain-containing protein [Alphaproteobacteria bacterium]